MAKRGRPSEYSQERADEICSQLAEGKSLRSVCRGEGMPHKTTVFRWLRTHEEFRSQYEKAKEESADALVEYMVDIADDGTNDFMAHLVQEKIDPDLKVCDLTDAQLQILVAAKSPENVQRSRLRVDTRKWAASKLKPKKYGDKVQHTGPDGDEPVKHVLETVIVDSREKVEP